MKLSKQTKQDIEEAQNCITSSLQILFTLTGKVPTSIEFDSVDVSKPNSPKRILVGDLKIKFEGD